MDLPNSHPRETLASLRPSRRARRALAELLDGPWRRRRRRVRRLGAGNALGALLELDRTRLVEAGLSPREAARVRAALDLGLALEGAGRRPSEPLATPESVHRYMEPLLRGAERESFHLLALDGRHRLRFRELVSLGTLTSSLVHPREVFRSAIRASAAAVVVVHNHPSGDPEPSREDVVVTERLRDAGELLGIPLLDHVVIGGAGFVSMRRREWGT